MRFILPIALVALMAGCTSMRENNAPHKEKMLVSAGFQQRVANTPEKQKALAALEPYRIQERTKQGKSYYVFPDPSQNCVYIGSATEYAAYKKLRMADKQNDQAQLQTAQMSAMEWGYWGPWNFGGVNNNADILYH